MSLHVQKDSSLPLLVLFFLHVIVYFIFFTLVVMGLQFLMHITLVQNEYAILISFSISIGLAVALFRKIHQFSWRHIITGSFFITCFIFFTGWLSGLIYDKSWDGMAYHQIAILEMAEGWNPCYEQLPAQWQNSKYFDRQVDMKRWVNHYSKGHEMFAASVFAFTKNIETGKMINLLLILAAFCSAFFLLLSIGNLPLTWKVLIALTAALNPVAVNQVFSYYLDGAVASCLLILISQLVLFFITEHPGRRLLIILLIGMVSVILINLKFTGLVYIAWITFVFICLLTYCRRFQLLKQFTVFMSIAGVIAILVTGINPYVTNTMAFGHPFHPVAGKYKVDAMAHMIPPSFEDKNRVERFFASSFARCDNISKGSSRQVEYKIPFTVTMHELQALQSEAIRLGGFGVLWSGILLLSSFIVVWLLVTLNRLRKRYLIALLVTILGSAFILPIAWWARFVPQLWLFPLVALIHLISDHRQVASSLAKLLVVLMLINSAIIGVVYSYSAYTNTKNARSIFAALKKSRKPVYVYTDIFSPNVLKLTSHGIPFVRVTRPEELGCPKPLVTLKMEMCPGKDDHALMGHIHE